MIKIVILDESKPISVYLKIQKLKTPKFVNCMFIIHKNCNKTSIQPILKLNSTSFMFKHIFCEMNIKKVIHWGGLGKWGNLLNFLFEMEFQVYTNIQAISTPVCHLFDDNRLVICNYSIFIILAIKTRLLKITFPVTSKPTPPQFSTYRHRTGFIVKRKQVHILKYLGEHLNWYIFYTNF